MKRKACAECKHNCKQDLERVCLKCLGDGGQEFEEKQQPRLIDANRLVSALNAHMAYYCDDTHEDMMIRSAIADVIVTVEEDSPTVEAEPVVHAHWYKDRFGLYHCSGCDGAPLECETGCLVNRHYEQRLSDFCPHCGAHMDEEVSENDR